MNILQLIAKVRDLIAAYRVGDWATAIDIAVDLLKLLFRESQPSPGPIRMASSPAKLAAFAAIEAKGDDELIAGLEGLCDQHDPAKGVQAQAVGPLVTMLIPIILALVKKWLGF